MVPRSPAIAVPAAVVDDFDTGGDEVVSTSGKKAKKYSGPKGPGLGERIAKIGGIPTILFGIGTFLVIWFTFMEPIGEAAITRAQAKSKAPNRTARPSSRSFCRRARNRHSNWKAMSGKTYEDKAKKINERLREARSGCTRKKQAPPRSITLVPMWFDKYGQLFGFVFLAFGCIGYLRTEQPLVMRIVAAVVLALMLLDDLLAGGRRMWRYPGPRFPSSAASGGIE